MYRGEKNRSGAAFHEGETTLLSVRLIINEDFTEACQLLIILRIVLLPQNNKQTDRLKS